MSPAEWGLSWEPGKRPQLSYCHRALAAQAGVTYFILQGHANSDYPYSSILALAGIRSHLESSVVVLWQTVSAVMTRKEDIKFPVLEEGPKNSSEGSGGKRDCT